MRLCNNILAAPKKTIEILRNTPLCDTKGVKRASRDVKHPNPLSSTMATMSQKYPITINKERAIRYKVPEELYLKVEDNHIGGRLLCRKEAVDWWVT